MLATGSTISSSERLETNPLFLTNVENKLSEFGREQIVNATTLLESYEEGVLSPTIVKFPTARATEEAADIVANLANIGRDRVVPEFTFLDGRGAGDLNGGNPTTVRSMLREIDERGDRPKPTIDGTPNETLEDVRIRLRQVLSVLETQYAGETILLIFADGLTPGVLLASCFEANSNEFAKSSWNLFLNEGEMIAFDARGWSRIEHTKNEDV